MCHAFLTDTNFYQLLTRIDESIAEEVGARGCHCGGVLHSARYPRKPRGLRSALDCSYESRLSFCCSQDGCRRRHTPASVRFLGRKVYLGVIVVLITALHHGLTDQRNERSQVLYFACNNLSFRNERGQVLYFACNNLSFGAWQDLCASSSRVACII